MRDIFFALEIDLNTNASKIICKHFRNDLFMLKMKRKLNRRYYMLPNLVCDLCLKTTS